MKSPQIVLKTGILHLMVYCILFFTGCNKELPTVTTDTITNITTNSATGGGKVLDDGDAGVIACGVCWSTNQSPTVNDNKTIDGSGLGPFSSIITALTPNTLYYVKAYVTNSEGTGYGNTVSFTTNPLLLSTVTTAQVTSITLNSAESGGNVISDGGAEITARGVCWGTSPDPTINDSKTIDGTGAGSFTSSLTELSRNSVYYVRAYAINSMGTSYGSEVQFTTMGELATVTTSIIAAIGSTSAMGGGNVPDDGGISVTARGVVWSTIENPTLDENDGFTENGTGTGEFTSDITNLMTENTYYVRAYATNREGTAYGKQESFATIFISGKPYADPRDGNVYNTVQIGNQCWLKENLRYLPGVSPSSAGSETEPHYYIYDYQGTDISEAVNTDNYNNYGVLYNWPAAMNGAGSSSQNPSDVQGVCPAGWHLPSDSEWRELVDYVVSQGYPNESDNPNGAGNALKSCRQVDSPLGGECNTVEHPRWNSQSTHYGTDQFGFSAIPGGGRGDWGSFIRIGGGGYWWASTEYSSAEVRGRLMDYWDSSVLFFIYFKDFGFSVRCVRDVD